MSKYTTGEIAKLCNVSVRTVQYYDTRKILIPSRLSEGGRRLYTEDDVKKLRIICFLRDAGIPINSIQELLEQEEPAKVISIIVQEQKKVLEEEQKECQKKFEMLDEIDKLLKTMDHFSVQSIGDVAHMMENKSKLKNIRIGMIAAAIPFGILEWTAFVLAIFQKIWWPFVLYVILAIPFVFFLFQYYWKNISYICPECHTIFKPRKMEAFFAKHTMTTRKLTCTCCGYKGFCVETYGKEKEKNEEHK